MLIRVLNIIYNWFIVLTSPVWVLPVLFAIMLDDRVEAKKFLFRGDDRLFK